MTEPFIGELRVFGFDFAPRGWAACQGQLLSIGQNTALFALLGTTYGGDGRTSFALPDLRGRMPLGAGHAAGLSGYQVGQSGGTETVRLTTDQMPVHRHGVLAAGTSTSRNPAGHVPAIDPRRPAYAEPQSVEMDEAMIEPAGGDQSHENLPPYLAVNWCIATEGMFPARP